MSVSVKLSGISSASWRVKGMIPTKVDLLWLASGLGISGSVKNTNAPSLDGRQGEGNTREGANKINIMKPRESIYCDSGAPKLSTV